MPENSSLISTYVLIAAEAPRALRRECKALKPYLPKSTSLPAFQLFPRDRPRYICCECGFVNFYCIPLCVWCKSASESTTLAFQGTMPRARTASAPPRVFWAPNELSLRTRWSSDAKGTTADRASTQLRDVNHYNDTLNYGSQRWREHNRTPSAPSFITTDPGIRDTHSSAVPPPYTHLAPSSGRSQTHKRSHSQPNALRIGHSSRPYYSVIRKGTSSYANSDARSSVATRSPRPASLALLSSASWYTCPGLIDDVDEEDKPAFAFAFVNPVAAHPSDSEARSPKRTLTARINPNLSSPVSVLYTTSRAAEKREELAALARQSGAVLDEAENLVTARLRKFQRCLRGLVRRTKRRTD
ncbi:hypothetical protein B0H14DRAFT_3763225 [Mycena olivaceomarginata]|nr:hypothetical protein B0H14DRAFT_3763225 [Mycena olivaceomarginata]